jgi:DnaJ-class molecular chaperone
MSDSSAGHEPDVEKFRNIVEAYQVLSVKESRAAFDITRKQNPHLYQSPISDEQYNMNNRRDTRDIRGVSPRRTPARGSYAEQRIA